ncbi:hypothetical protein A1O1_08610 [Capronia coronata CBS 617.96]|uniref:Uncharacterized protein n=1 Tax=Capronia coronata CBS 617.96 TaxID=1182541 RepID=W9XT05_9EURO|nr:uncharacterized protein A1O1_08610 [Capronia coronata CBS 617.96]EXJ80465.1 hypothetical protein A1O1_08610 [Capronia coronata CBS 617.96]
MNSVPSPPPRSPDRLLPGAAAVRSWGSASPPPQGSSHLSVSDQSEYSEGSGQHQPTSRFQQPAPMDPTAAGYVAEIHGMPEEQRNVHQLPDDQVQPRASHQRNISGVSGPSADSAGGPYYSGQQSAQESYELPGQSAGPAAAQSGAGYRGVDPEVPLHQRVPIRAGHIRPSTNF